MPPIVSISLKNGIEIDCGFDLPGYKLSSLPKIAVTDTPKSYGEKVTALVQEAYLDKQLTSSFTADDRVNLGNLLTNENIQKIAGKDYLVTTRMYVKVIVRDLNLLKLGDTEHGLNICCSDFPITVETF